MPDAPMTLVFAVDDPRAADVQAVLAAHVAFSTETSPPGHAHVLDTAGLAAPAITFVGGRRDGELVVVGALRELGAGDGEIKSMHVAERFRGIGAGSAMVGHLIGLAAQRGMRRVSIETGSMNAFAPARAMYAKAGFVPCEAFGSYAPSVHSSFMTLELQRPADGDGH